MRYKNKYKLRLSSENNLCWTPSDYNLMSRSESFTLAGLISTVLYNRYARFNHMEGLFIFARMDRTMGCVLHYNNTEIINGYEVRDWLQDNVHKSWVYDANNFIVDDKKALPELCIKKETLNKIFKEASTEEIEEVIDLCRVYHKIFTYIHRKITDKLYVQPHEHFVSISSTICNEKMEEIEDLLFHLGFIYVGECISKCPPFKDDLLNLYKIKDFEHTKTLIRILGY